MSEAKQGVLYSPETYREMSKPHASLEEANKEITAFEEAVFELRKKHKIADVYIVISDSMINEEGKEGQFFLTFQMGDALKSEGMLAYALGRAQKERQERIGEILAGSGIRHSNRK